MEPFEIRFSGSGGQGLQLSAKILAKALNIENMRVASSQSYEPTSRGGVSRSDLVVADRTPDYPLVTKLAYLIILNQCAADISKDLLHKDSVVLIDPLLVKEPPKGKFTLYTLPFTETAVGLGNKRVANIIALGALVGLGGIVARESLLDAVRSGVPPKYLDLNLEALDAGFQMTTLGAQRQKEAQAG